MVAGESAAPSSLQAVIDRGGLQPVQIGVVVLCSLVAVAEGIDLNIIPLLAPAIRADWGLSTETFSAILTAGPIGLILGGVSIGYFSDRVGRRWALIGAMIVMTLATLATAFVKDVPQLLVCRVLTGIGFGGVIPVSTTLVAEFLPTKFRANVVALVVVGQSFGGLFAALLLKTPLGAASWQTIILYASALCAATTLVLFAALPESPRYLLLKHAGSPRTSRALKDLRITDTTVTPDAEGGVRRRQFLDLFTGGRALGTILLWATFIGVCAPLSFFTSWLTLIYTYAGKTAATGVSASAFYLTGAIVGGIAPPLFCMRWDVSKVLMALVLAAAASCLVQAWALPFSDMHNYAAAFACGFFICGAFYLLYPPAVRFYPTAIRSTGVGSAVAFGRIGNTISPAATGLLLGAGQTPAFVFSVMAAPLVFSFAALLLFDRVSERQTD